MRSEAKRFVRNLFYRVALGDPDYRFLFEAPPREEAVVVDCETTGLNPSVDDIVSLAAVHVRGNRILTSERFEFLISPDIKPTSSSIKIHHIRVVDVEGAEPMRKIIPSLLRFIGSRPIVGYYVDFDVAMLDKYILGRIQSKLPNRRIDVSEMYYALKYRTAPPEAAFDLRFSTILNELGIPSLGQHAAVDDAVMTAMIYLQLRDLQVRGVSLRRRRSEGGNPVPL